MSWRRAAPWTMAQVESLNRWQARGDVHPFTCGGEHADQRELIATCDGWRCGACDYRQDWAHEFMFEGAQ